MSLGRAIAGISVIICVIGLTAIGQEGEAAHQTAPNTQLERCKTAMPIILKNYNNAKYAVFRAGNSADAAVYQLQIIEVCSLPYIALLSKHPPLHLNPRLYSPQSALIEGLRAKQNRASKPRLPRPCNNSYFQGAYVWS